MSKLKYHYCIVNKENGYMLIQDGKLPMYWMKKLAQEECKNFTGYVVVRIPVDSIQKLILSSK